MKKRSLRISSEALLDLEKIWIFTCEKWSKDQADRYYNLLMEEIDYLRLLDKIGRSADYIREGYCVSFVKSHIIFYRIGNDNALEIIRILHQRMNIDDWLI